MARYFAAILSGFLVTAVAVGGVWFAAPRVVGDRAPAGLLGMIASIGIVASLVAARRMLPIAAESQRRT